MTSQTPSSTPGSIPQPALPRCPRESYVFGIVCVRDFEKAAIIAALDSVHERHEAEVGDENDYTFGRLCQHNVIVACPPAHVANDTPVITSVVNSIMRSFSVTASLLVGVCEAITTAETNVTLGDIVVSHLETGHGAMVQLDLDTDGDLQRTTLLPSAPEPLLSAIQKLRARPRETRLRQHLEEMSYRHPEIDLDLSLRRSEQTQDESSTSGVVRGPLRALRNPGGACHCLKVHYDPIAAGHTRIHDRLTTNQLAEHQDILAHDPEVAGLTTPNPCVIVRGMCKLTSDAESAQWQRLAAATAACYAKELLGTVQILTDPAPLYRPLNFNRFETRFLEICPQYADQDPSEFEVKLHAESLIHPSEYVALSYCWGDHKSTELITVNGISRLVTTNLKIALQNLRSRGVKRVWVDALSIDQSNHHERIYQLSQIGSIFSKASKVVTWLGPTADDSHQAMQALSRLAANDNKLRETPSLTAKESAAIISLLERPYGRRVWIIQEISKASAVQIWCGDQLLTWDHFVRGFHTWKKKEGLSAQTINSLLEMITEFCKSERKSREGHAARMLLTEAMIRTIHAESTLQKDRVYALLGLCRDGHEIVPTPNYMQDDKELFQFVLKYAIVEQNQLHLIALGGGHSTASGLPSWLPTWTGRRSLSSTFAHLIEDQRDQGILGVRRRRASCSEHSLRLAVKTRKVSQRHYSPRHDDGLQDYAIAHQMEMLYACLTNTIPDTSHTGIRGGHILAAIWSQPAGVLPYPDLRAWFEDHLLYILDPSRNLTLEECVHATSSQTTAMNDAIALLLSDCEYSLDPVYHSRRKTICGAESWARTLGSRESKLMPLLSRNDPETAPFSYGDDMIMVPTETQYGDYVALLPDDKTAIVIRPNCDGRFTVVGHMASPVYCIWDTSDHEGYETIELV